MTAMMQELELIKQQIAQYCAFSLGKQVLHESEVHYEPLIIERENHRIQEALACCVRYGSLPFGQVKDLKSVLSSAQKGICLTPQQCVDVMHLIEATARIHQFMKQVETPHDSLDDLVNSIEVYTTTYNKLKRVFDDDGELLDTASPSYRGLKQAVRSAEEKLSRVAAQFVSEHSDKLMEQIVTTRNHRTVVLAKNADKNTFGGFIHGVSASGQAAYVEPPILIELNNQRQTAQDELEDEIRRILVQCSCWIEEIAEGLSYNIDTLAILDALFAKAEWGKREDATVATLTHEKEIRLTNSRHPLIDRKKVVTNSYHLAKPHRMLLITGPNTGGKTVSMKVLLLAVLSTYMGIPVCADEAVIPYFDGVYVDIGDDQSVVQSLSTFSSHMSKLTQAVKNATEHSFVLLDEIGSGTDPKEGEALAIAILNELRAKGAMVVATTHYSRLKNYGKRHEDILLASVQFDMEKLMPTYHYLEGLTGQSNAFEVAKRLGLDEKIIKEATFLKNQAKSQEDELIEKLESQLILVQQQKEQLQQQLKETAELKETLQQQQQAFEQVRQNQMDIARQEAQEYLTEVQEEAKKILKEVMEQAKSAKYHEILKTSKKLDELHFDEAEDEDEETLQVGDYARLVSSNQVGVVTEIQRNQVTLNINGIKVRSKLNQVRKSHQKPVEVKKKTVHQKTIQSFKLECNVIGMHVEEALQSIDKYLDEAKVHKAVTVRLVHGKGTGALQKAVHDYLRRNKSVSEFRFGTQGEGGVGATVVTLKSGGNG